MRFLYLCLFMALRRFLMIELIYSPFCPVRRINASR